MTQKDALDVLKMGHNVYLTGSAGSGKTYVLNQYIKYLKEHDVDVGITASTGIAATHMNGTTIHSWSGLGVRDVLTRETLDLLEEKQYLWKRFQNAKVLIIDEVSMLHHFRLDLIDELCRFFKRNDVPFGGMQVILCGDFFQLPPIARGGEPKAHFIYKSEAWKKMDLKVCYLHEQFRQKDDALLHVLNDIRGCSVSEKTREHLLSRAPGGEEACDEPASDVRPTRLYTHNIDVDAENAAELEKIPSAVRIFEMNSNGRGILVETLKKTCLAPATLRLKTGAQVMFVKNNFDAGYVNGTLGKIISFDIEGHPVVRTFSGKTIVASPMEWQIEDAGKKLATISQVPLRLAWAITVHKSQGMSLDAVEVDLSRSFEMGMGYVALSRVRTLAGLKLMGINEIALKVDPEVAKFDASLKNESKKTEVELNALPTEKKHDLQERFLERVGHSVKKKEKKIPTQDITRHMVMERKSLDQMAKERGLTAETIIGHIEKLQEAGEDLDIEYLKDVAFNSKKFKKVIEALETSFKKHGDYRVGPVKYMLGPSFTYEEIRLARLFL